MWKIIEAYPWDFPTTHRNHYQSIAVEWFSLSHKFVTGIKKNRNIQSNTIESKKIEDIRINIIKHIDEIILTYNSSDIQVDAKYIISLMEQTLESYGAKIQAILDQ